MKFELFALFILLVALPLGFWLKVSDNPELIVVEVGSLMSRDSFHSEWLDVKLSGESFWRVYNCPLVVGAGSHGEAEVVCPNKASLIGKCMKDPNAFTADLEWRKAVFC